jgi:glycine/D-amino acid oxidase-like deaminating enzyme
MKQLLHWFPRLDPVPAFSWAGTFAETADGLPFFGPHAQWGRGCISPWPTAATASPIR